MTHSLYKTIGSGLERVNIVTFVFLFIAAKLLISYVFARLTIILTNAPITEGFPDLGDDQQAFVIIVLLAPVIETYLFQYLFFKYFNGRLGPAKIVLVSASVFSLFHLYNVGYFIYAFFSGALLSLSYACRMKSNPFLCTSLIHVVYNLAVFVLNRWDY